MHIAASTLARFSKLSSLAQHFHASPHAERAQCHKVLNLSCALALFSLVWMMMGAHTRPRRRHYCRLACAACVRALLLACGRHVTEELPRPENIMFATQADEKNDGPILIAIMNFSLVAY